MPEGNHQGELYTLHPAQKRLIRESLDGAKVAIWSMARASGKSGLIAALVVFLLYDREVSNIVVVATAMRSARLVYGRAVDIIRLNPRLLEQALIFYSANPSVELPHRRSTLQPLPADPDTIIGQGPYVVIVDEVGMVSMPVFEVMVSSLGKVPDSLLLGIGTPGLGVPDPDENVLYRIKTLDPKPDGLVYREFSASPGDDPSKVRTWRKANPMLGWTIGVDDVRLQQRTMLPSVFARLVLGLWTQGEDAWIVKEDWDALPVDPSPIAPGTSIALGFDGSVSIDGTALVALELQTGRLVVLGYWEPPRDAPRSWRIPRKEVMDTIHAAFRDHSVSMLFMDPHEWRSEIEELTATYPGRVMGFNTAAPARMAPACDLLRTAILDGTVAHDGSPSLTAHMLRATAVSKPEGEVVVKDRRQRGRRIDIAVAAILAKAASMSETYVEPVPQVFF